MVGADRLGVDVHHYRADAAAAQRLDGLDAAVVELDALRDAYRAGAEDHDAALVRAVRVVASARRAVVVAGAGGELARAAVDLTVARGAALSLYDIAGLFLRQPGGAGYLRGGEALHRGARYVAVDCAVLFEIFFRELYRVELFYEVAADVRPARYLVDRRRAAAQKLRYRVEAQVRRAVDLLPELARLPRAQLSVGQGFAASDGAPRLRQRLGEVRAYREHFACRLHARAEREVRLREAVEGPRRDLDRDVVERGLGERAARAGDGVRHLGKFEAERYLRRHARDRVAGRLAREGAGAARARVHFYYIILAAVRRERELHVAGPADVERVYYLERRGAQHLPFLVREGQRRRYDYRVARVDAHRVDVLHSADGERVSGAVADDLDLHLVPALEVALYQRVSDRRGGEGVLRLDDEVLYVTHDRVSRAAEREVRAQNQRQRRMQRELLRLRDGRNSAARDDGLPRLEHRAAEGLARLGALHGVRLRSEYAALVALPYPELFALHAEVQPRLSAERRDDAVGVVLLEYFLNHVRQQRADIYDVRDRAVRLYRSGVAVQQDDAASFFFKRAAGLRTRVVELRCLAYLYRAGAQHKNFSYSCVSHPNFSPGARPSCGR